MATNGQIREALWGLGVPAHLLEGLPLNASFGEFTRALEARGVNLNLLGRAQALATWRANPDAPLWDNFKSMMRAAGFSDADIDRVGDRTHQIRKAAGRGSWNADDLRQATQEVLGREVGINANIKLGIQPKDPDAWNPFRGDVPKPPKRWVPVQPPPPTRGEIPPAPDQGPVDLGIDLGLGDGRDGAPVRDTPVTPPVEERLTPEQRLSRLQAAYGWGAAFADIPEVNAILNDVANGDISIDKADDLFKASQYYRNTTALQRQWKIFENGSPIEAREQLEANVKDVTRQAKQLGIRDPDPGRMRRLGEVALRNGWSDDEVRRALAAELQWDPDGVKTGLMAEIDVTTREWLVPLSDHSKTVWAQSLARGDKTMEEFVAYNREMAKSLFPALSTAFDDPATTTRTYLDPYAQDAASLLGMNPEDIDWMDPKWNRFFNHVDPKTNQRAVATRADMARTIINDPTYGWEKTHNGQRAKREFTQGLMEMFGFSFGGRR